jgi:predicted CoA-binding protein
MLEHESFWENNSFAIVTDKTKPAMKLTMNELARIGKRVYVVDLSDCPGKEMMRSISDIPSDIDCAVIGLKKENTENAIVELNKKGIKKCWVHWRTQTLQAKQKGEQLQMQCITGRCPMMYLSRGLNIHTIHRSLANSMRWASRKVHKPS